MVDKGSLYIRLKDFSLSRKLEDAKKDTNRSGTPYYIAPEVLRKKGYNEK